MKKIVTFYGQPGCGKSTQAQILAEKYGFFKFGMGERLREEAESGSDLGKKIAPYLSAGTLIPDDLMREIIKNIGQKSGPQGIIFDGFPRIVSQAEMLAEIALELGWGVGNFFYLRLKPEQALQRIMARAKISSREDDVSPEAINNRFAVFERESKPLLEYYRAQNKLIEVDASLDIVGMQTEIKKNL
jgi:adenylate kinase